MEHEHLQDHLEYNQLLVQNSYTLANEVILEIFQRGAYIFFKEPWANIGDFMENKVKYLEDLLEENNQQVQLAFKL